MSSIFFIRDAPGSANFKTKIWRIYVIRMLSGSFSLYITGPKILTILKNFSFVKFNLLLGLTILISIILILSVLYRKYTLFLFLRVSSQNLFLLANFFIALSKEIRLS